MDIINASNKEKPLIEELSAKQLSRRKFMSWAGVIGAAATVGSVATACKKDDKNNNNGGVDLGSGDVGVLNYAYALEQLEAAFYTQVAMSFYSGATDLEKQYLAEIRDHEIAHREFFKKALAGNAIQDLQVDFSSINFADRTSVLGTAKAFEDLGVSAYNGAGKLLQSVDYLLLAGKIVSVEARHAALVRDLISNGTFADNTVIDANGLDKSRTPSEVLAIAGTYIKTKINASNLPTS
jgi:hypothetical protein